jgi:hypothetical protein
MWRRVGGADDIGAARDRRGDEMHVMSVELAADDPELFRQALQQLLARPSRQVVDDLADRLVVQPRLLRERATDCRFGSKSAPNASRNSSMSSMS